MSHPADGVPRRQVLKTLGAASAGIVVTGGSTAPSEDAPIRVAGSPVEVTVEPVTRVTVHVTYRALEGGSAP